MKKTAIYIRVSTEEQAREGYSIEAQKHITTKYCFEHQLEITGYYIDEGISGKNISGRPELKRLLADAEKGLFNNILIWRTSRISRKAVDLLSICEFLLERGINLIATDEDININSTTGKFMLTILAAVAENERNTIAENSRFGKEQKARSGKYNPGRTPYGYNWDKENRKLVINEYEAEWVRKMYRMHLDGISTYVIAKTLNENNIPNKNGAKFWYKSTVQKILANPTYCGVIEHRQNSKKRGTAKYEVVLVRDSIDIPPIIDKDTFYLTRSILESRRKSNLKKYPDEKHYFGEVLYCQCGRKMSSKKRNSYHLVNGERRYEKITFYYDCENHRKAETGTSRCPQQSKSNGQVEKAFLKYIKNFDLEKVNIDKLNQQNEIIPLEKQKAGLYSQLEKINKRKKNLQIRFLDGIIDQDDFLNLQNEFEKESETIKNQIVIIDEEIAQIKKTIPSAESIKHIEELASQIETAWELMSDKEKRNFITQNISKIVIKDYDIIAIDFRSPQSTTKTESYKRKLF